MDLNLAPGVYLPVYQSLEVALLQALEHASLVHRLTTMENSMQWLWHMCSLQQLCQMKLS